jgi:uncharacterized protein YciI
MAIFAVTLKFTDDHERRLATRPIHREFLMTQLDAGKLVLAGPYVDDTGALVVYEAADKAEVEAILAADPYATTGGIVEHLVINEWNMVISRYA